MQEGKQRLGRGRRAYRGACSSSPEVAEVHIGRRNCKGRGSTQARKGRKSMGLAVFKRKE